MARAMRFVGRALFFVVSCCLVLLVCAAFIASRGMASTGRPSFVAGFAPVIVLSGSMEPAYPVGSVLVIKKTPPSVLEAGDAITFVAPGDSSSPGGRLVTHRVISAEGSGRERVFRTKGDANATPDRLPVPARDVIGKAAFAVPYLGYASLFARSGTGFLSLVVVPALLIAAIEVSSIVKQYRTSGQARSAEETR